MGATPWYCTREEVKAAIDSVETARNNRRVDRACYSATLAIETLCRRKFYPTVATRYFDWPHPTSPTSYRLWVPDLLSVSSLVADGVAIGASDYFLYPGNETPYRSIELDRSDTSVWGTGDTPQRNIAITGTWGYCNDADPAGALAEDLTAVETDIDITDSSDIGVGDAILVGTEYMIVLAKSLVTTSQTLQTPMTASAANTSCAVTNGALYFADEMITLDSERMMIEDVAGNTLIVKRAVDGTALAAHTGSTIYAPRTLTCERGALGTTAATHLAAAAGCRHRVPPLVKSLAVGEALNVLLSEGSGWARVAGEGVSARPASGSGLAALRTQVEETYGVRVQHAAV